MNTNKLPVEIREDLVKFLAHMPIKSDSSLSILKGHLLVEELIWHLILSKVRHPEELEKIRFSFEQSIYLAKSLSETTGESWVWEAVKKLNEIRNKFAHKLKPSNIDNHIRDFCNIVKNAEGVNSPEQAIETLGELHWYIGMLYISLAIKLRIKPLTMLELASQNAL